jgi:hypothetical protein
VSFFGDFFAGFFISIRTWEYFVMGGSDWEEYKGWDKR